MLHPGGLAIVALLVTALLGFAAPASGKYLHQKANYAFGVDGTSATQFPTGETQFGMAYNQPNKRLYVGELVSPAKLYGFNFLAPGSFTPVGGSFPLDVTSAGFQFMDLAVDSTTGASANNLYWAPAGATINGYTSTGASLPAFSPAEPGTKCGVGVDNEGKVWISNWSTQKIEKFNPTGGTPIGSISTTAQGNPCRVTFDPSNNDMYVAMSNAVAGQGIVRYTAASGYSPSSVKVYSTDTNARIALNGAKDVLYAVVNQVVIRVWDTVTGNLLEEFGQPGGCFGGVAVDETTDTVFVPHYCQRRVQEWRGVIIPDVTTGPPVANSKVSGSIALAGGGPVTECTFDFGASVGYGSQQPCEPATPYNSDQSVTAELPGLTPEQTYHYRLVAKNANGEAKGEDKTITPHYVPGLKTISATNINRTTATLNASFEGNGEETKYYFQWGPDTGYGNETAVPPGESAGSPTGLATISANISGLTAGKTYHYRVIATNGAGTSIAQDETFTASPAIKDLTTQAATNVDTEGATLKATLDPDGFETTYYFQWGKDTTYGQTTPLPPGDPVGTTSPGITQVATNLGDLERGTTYHYRVVAINSFGTTFGSDETFSTPQPPSINSFAAVNVTETTADLIATVNPNGYTTTYYFEYGPTPAYGESAPVPLGELAASNASENVTVPITGLEGVTYHFRLRAENQWGETFTENQTFDFNPPRGCPNHTVRQQTGAGYLPDCRAYELASAARAGGASLFPNAPTSSFVSGAGRFAYSAVFNAIPGSGEPINSLFMGDMYVASRTTTGWYTRYVGIPGYQSIGDSGAPSGDYGFDGWTSAPATRDLNRILVWDRKTWHDFFNAGALEGTYAPYVFDNDGNIVNQLPTNVDEVPEADKDMKEGGYKGSVRITPDLSHFAFSAINVAFAPGGLTESPGSAYDNDVGADTVTLISKTPTGDDIPKDPLGGLIEEYIRIPTISEDGTHILMSTAGPGGTTHLYMRVNQAVSYDISKDQFAVNQPVKFEGMTSDGSRVYFTTDKQMTADDADLSRDLYMWTEETDSVTRISGNGGAAGNTDSCAAGSWTSGCSVEVVQVTPVARKSFDSAMAREAGDIYFYSPEFLDGARGFPNKRNLYVYRNGDVKHVATLEPSGNITRINVTDDGRYAAFVTVSKLTAYDNAGKAEMYKYDADARTVGCVSCLPSGAPPANNVEGSQNGLFLTEDGRTFFATRDPLVAQDANGIRDVYEFVLGRPQLISTGTGDNQGTNFQPIGLVGVTENGVDVFFSTYETLVPQDENGAQLKFYDARTNGGFPVGSKPAPCAAADECHGPTMAAPAPLESGTGADLGEGGNRRAAPRKRRSCKGLRGKPRKRCIRKRARQRQRRSARDG